MATEYIRFNEHEEDVTGSQKREQNPQLRDRAELTQGIKVPRL